MTCYDPLGGPRPRTRRSGLRLTTPTRHPCDEGVLRAAPAAPAAAQVNATWVLATAILGSSMAFVDGTAVNVAMPALQKSFGASVSGAQWVVEAYALFLAGLLLVGGALGDRFGRRRIFALGVAALGFALLARPGVGGSYWTTFFPAVVVLGLGMATTVAPLTTTVMGAVEVRHAGVASGINNAVSRVAGLLAVAVCGIVLVAGFNAGREQRLARLGLPPAARAELDRNASQLAGAPIPPDLPKDLQEKVRRTLDDAFVDGFRRAILVAAGLALLSSVAAAVMIEGRTSTQEKQRGER